MGRPSAPPNWTVLKAQFIASDSTLTTFAREVKIAKNTLSARAKREDWEQARQESRERIAARTIKATENDAVAIRRRHQQVAGNLVVRIGQKVLAGDVTPAELNQLAAALDKAAPLELVSGGHAIAPLKVEMEHTGTIGVGLVVLPELDKP